MDPMQRRGSAVRRLLAAGVALFAAAGCTDAERQPLGPSGASLSAPAQESAFYYYFNERIPLAVEPGELSVVSNLPPQASARAALATLGIEVAGAEPLPQAPSHWLLRLSRADAAKAVQAARALRADARFGFAANVYRETRTGSRVVLLDRVAVRLKDGWNRADLARLNAELGTRVVREPVKAEADVVWLEYRRGGDPLELAAKLQEHPLVQWADADKVQDRRLLATPTDPFYSGQYYARNDNFLGGVRVDVNAEPAWDLTLGAWSAAAGPLTIAVVDDGVQVSHPDLDFAFSWGYNAFTGSFEWTYQGCTSCSINPGGNYSHGTLVAGVIGAQHNNGVGLAGIAPAAQIMPIRIFNDAGSPASDNQIAQAINTAWYNGAHIMNNSWGGGAASTAITSAIGRAVTEGRGGKGTVMVFAAGNTSRRSIGSIGAVQYPGSLSNVLTVSAINRSGASTDYAPDGAAIDVVAPSGHTTGQCIGDVISIDLTGSRGCNDGPGGDIDYSGTFSGTSAAAPQAAAVAAMVLSRNGTLTELQIRDQIKAAADPWGTANTFGAGKLNAYRALVGRISVSISGIRTVPIDNDYTWTASVSGGAGSYTYRWERADGSSTFYYQVGTGSSYTSYVGYNQTFKLRLVVTDGPDAQTSSSTITVRGPSSGTPTCSVSTAPAQLGQAQSPAQSQPQAIIIPPACRVS
jgi:hypothetical protein